MHSMGQDRNRSMVKNIDELIIWAIKGLKSEINKQNEAIGMAEAWGTLGFNKGEKEKEIQKLKNKLKELEGYLT